MNCFIHDRTPAIGMCSVCQKAMCRECVGRDTPRLVCRTCLARPAVLGFEYQSGVSIGSWPLIHVCLAVDPATNRPKVARGIIAIGNVAVGGVAIAGLAFGVVAIGGLSIGLALALGGAALGLGISVGGFAVGAVALGGAAIGFVHAFGGAAFGPSVIDNRHCDPATAELLRHWVGSRILPPHCR
jgi:hypothetical protein